MLESVQDACRLGVESYGGRPREAWVLEWPGQVVLVGSAIFWTAEVSASLSSTVTGERVVDLLSIVLGFCLLMNSHITVHSAHMQICTMILASFHGSSCCKGLAAVLLIRAHQAGQSLDDKLGRSNVSIPAALCQPGHRPSVPTAEGLPHPCSLKPVHWPLNGPGQ